MKKNIILRVVKGYARSVHLHMGWKFLCWEWNISQSEMKCLLSLRGQRVDVVLHDHKVFLTPSPLYRGR